MKDDKLSIVDGKLCIKDNAFTNHDYSIFGEIRNQGEKSEIVYCPYVPEVLSEEEYAKRFYANKTYAFVKYDYPDDKYANQKGEVLDERTNANGSKSYLLKINVRQKAKGHIHFVALKPIYEEVWFDESNIERFLKYDENGKMIG